MFLAQENIQIFLKKKKMCACVYLSRFTPAIGKFQNLFPLKNSNDSTGVFYSGDWKTGRRQEHGCTLTMLSVVPGVVITYGSFHISLSALVQHEVCLPLTNNLTLQRCFNVNF